MDKRAWQKFNLTKLFIFQPNQVIKWTKSHKKGWTISKRRCDYKNFLFDVISYLYIFHSTCHLQQFCPPQWRGCFNFPTIFGVQSYTKPPVITNFGYCLMNGVRNGKWLVKLTRTLRTEGFNLAMLNFRPVIVPNDVVLMPKLKSHKFYCSAALSGRNLQKHLLISWTRFQGVLIMKQSKSNIHFLTHQETQKQKIFGRKNVG